MFMRGVCRDEICADKVFSEEEHTPQSLVCSVSGQLAHVDSCDWLTSVCSNRKVRHPQIGVERIVALAHWGDCLGVGGGNSIGFGWSLAVAHHVSFCRHWAGESQNTTCCVANLARASRTL